MVIPNKLNSDTINQEVHEG